MERGESLKNKSALMLEIPEASDLSSGFKASCIGLLSDLLRREDSQAYKMMRRGSGAFRGGYILGVLDVRLPVDKQGWFFQVLFGFPFS